MYIVYKNVHKPKLFAYITLYYINIYKAVVGIVKNNVYRYRNTIR